MFEAPGVPGDYVLWMSPRDDETKRVTSLELFDVRASKAVPLPDGHGYLLLKDVLPGKYVVRMMTTQGWWGACLSEATVTFPVEAGKITYVGRVDPSLTLKSIMSEAFRTGKTTSSGGQLRLFKENVIPPHFDLAAALPADQALEIARKNMLVTDAKIVTAKTEPSSFIRKDKTDLTGYCQ